jgi:hypothetical protein
MTLAMMEKYGWWNVRGGHWTKVEMQSCPQALLEDTPNTKKIGIMYDL